MFMELTTAVKIKLQKYLIELPTIFTCAAALNLRVNVIEVDTLIDEININLKLYKHNVEWGNFTKAKFANDFKALYDVYNNKHGNSIQTTFFNPLNFRGVLLHPKTPLSTYIIYLEMKM